MTMEQGFIDIFVIKASNISGKSGNRHWDRSASNALDNTCLAVHRHNPWFFTGFTKTRHHFISYG
jgi:hypothetical protein